METGDGDEWLMRCRWRQVMEEVDEMEVEVERVMQMQEIDADGG
jgi:hypothetical protein